MIDHALQEAVDELTEAGGALIGFADHQQVLGSAGALVAFWEQATVALKEWGREVSELKSRWYRSDTRTQQCKCTTS